MRFPCGGPGPRASKISESSGKRPLGTNPSSAHQSLGIRGLRVPLPPVGFLPDPSQIVRPLDMPVCCCCVLLQCLSGLCLSFGSSVGSWVLHTSIDRASFFRSVRKLTKMGPNVVPVLFPNCTPLFTLFQLQKATFQDAVCTLACSCPPF